MSNFQGILDWRQASRIQVLLMQGPSTGPGVNLGQTSA